MARARILIVEDDAIVAEHTQVMLKNRGFAVTAIVTSGAEALAMVNEKSPDLVLMDIMLKGEMSGIQAADEIRLNYDVPVVYVTAYADEELVDRTKVTEPFGYIIKPFGDNELNTAIEMALYKHKIEKKLRQSEQWFSTTLNSIGDAVITTDKNGIVTFLNPVAQSLTGWYDEAAIGKQLEDVFNIIDEETRKRVDNPIAKVLREGKTVGLANHTILIAINGREVPIDNSVAPINDESGNVTGMVLTFRDIAERKRAEEELQLTQFSVDHSTDAVYWMGPDAKFIYVNYAAVEALGYSKEELLTMTVHDIGPEFPVDIWQAHWAELKEKKSFIIQTIHQRKNKTTFPVEITVNFIQFGNREINCAIAKDISERKKIEDQLRQSSKMESIGTIAGGIAHDFNNLLFMIVGNAELALEDIPEWNQTYANLEEIKTASLRASDIVKQLLNFSRKTDQKFIPIGAVTVIKDTLKFLRAAIPTTVEIQRHLPDTDITVMADPIQINQLLMNLCTNASQAMEKTGGTLEITVENEVLTEDSVNNYPDLTTGEHVKITVSDTGPGIDPETIDRIFDPYFTTKDVGKGSGMGLAVVHGIVNSHNGAITVDSELGKGATFTVLFPVVSDEPVMEAKPSSDKIPRGNETILFVDDEESITIMIRQMLERLGYQVETQLNPEEALELFKSKPQDIDLVITDMTMPQMTGVSLSKKLKTVRSDIPVIICTGHSSLIDEDKAKELGIDAFAIKPIVKKDIAKAIRKVLDNKESSG